jgi:Zn-dependent peptidase ImmA (M78 family)
MNERTFRIGSVDYTVAEVEGLADKYHLYGQVTYNDTHIEIDASTSPTRKHNVLIHELLHAMLFEAGFDDQDEDLVNRLGHVLHQTLRDNDFRFIRGEASE